MVAAVVAALPFGWGLGVIAAYLIAGGNFGQLPALTVPLGIVAAVVFALSPIGRPATRLAIMIVGTGIFLLLGFALA
jgi:hypothetical protein